jgi:hypothetical protein
MHTAERGPRSRNDRTAAGRFDPVQQAPVAQQFHDLPVEAAGLRGLPQPRLPLQYLAAARRQAQLTGQHQTDRTGAHDNDVGVHHPALPAWSATMRHDPDRSAKPGR